MAVISAKRAINLSRHLPAQGWRPIILCNTPTRERVDPALAQLVGTESIISPTYRRPSSRARLSKKRVSSPKGEKRSLSKPSVSLFERLTGWSAQYISPFDREWVEVGHATREGIRLAQEHNVEAVAVSADPWSALITAWRVSDALDLPLVIDFRDPWTLHSGKSKLRPPPTLAFMRWYERRLFARADRVILNTESCERAYRERDGHLWPAERLTHIRNAFDSTMFGEWCPPRPLKGRPFELTYFGQFRKFVRPDGLYRGVSRFIEQRGLSVDDFKLVMISPLDVYAAEAMKAYGLEPYIESRPSVSFTESFEVLQQADALALVDGGCPLVIAGKLYDYLCAGRPILSVAESDEVNNMILSSEAGEVASPHVPEEVAERLGALYDRAHCDSITGPDPQLRAAYDAPAQAERYAQVLEDALVSHRKKTRVGESDQSADILIKERGHRS